MAKVDIKKIVSSSDLRRDFKIYTDGITDEEPLLVFRGGAGRVKRQNLVIVTENRYEELIGEQIPLQNNKVK